MTEIEKQAEEYVKNIISIAPKMYDAHKKIIMKESYKDGAKWGMEHAIEWHDPIDDFPEDKRKGDEFYCKLKDETLDMEWYEVLIWDIEYQTEDIYQVPVDYMFKSLKTGKDVSDYVIAWCELPQFKDKE